MTELCFLLFDFRNYSREFNATNTFFVFRAVPAVVMGFF